MYFQDFYLLSAVKNLRFVLADGDIQKIPWLRIRFLEKKIMILLFFLVSVSIILCSLG